MSFSCYSCFWNKPGTDSFAWVVDVVASVPMSVRDKEKQASAIIKIKENRVRNTKLRVGEMEGMCVGADDGRSVRVTKGDGTEMQCPTHSKLLASSLCTTRSVHDEGVAQRTEYEADPQ